MCVTRHAQITQNNEFAIFLQYLKKELTEEVDFLHAGKQKSLLQIDSMILMGIVRYYQSSQNSKFAMSLQYPKKEVKDEAGFWHADKRKSFYKLVLSFLLKVARHVQNNQNRKLVIFLKYIKKNCCNCFVFYCDAKHADIVWRSTHVLCYFSPITLIKLFLFLKTCSGFFFQFGASIICCICA